MSIRRLTVMAVFAGALTVSMAAAGAAAARSVAAQPDRTLTGVWRTAVTPLNCATLEPLAPQPLQGLFTFHEGGTMAEWGVPPGSSPALRSPGHGLWQSEHGWQQYSLSFIFYRYDPSGVLVGSTRVAARGELDAAGDRLTTRSSITLHDAAGNQVGTGCAAAVAVRFE